MLSRAQPAQTRHAQQRAKKRPGPAHAVVAAHAVISAHTHRKPASSCKLQEQLLLQELHELQSCMRCNSKSLCHSVQAMHQDLHYVLSYIHTSSQQCHGCGSAVLRFHDSVTTGAIDKRSCTNACCFVSCHGCCSIVLLCHESSSSSLIYQARGAGRPLILSFAALRIVYARSDILPLLLVTKPGELTERSAALTLLRSCVKGVQNNESDSTIDKITCIQRVTARGTCIEQVLARLPPAPNSGRAQR